MSDLISIIVPVYNAEATLDRCVSALTKQSYQNIEILLVNDGSKDTSLDICRRYEAQDPRIRVINKSNRGVSSARNAGLDIARGEFIMFCDSDDWSEPDWCEEMISHYEDGCLIMCGHYVEGEQNFIPHEIRASEQYERYARKDFYKLKLCNFNAPWNKLYSAAVIQTYSLRFNEQLTNGEDYLFILQYLTCISGDILFLDKCVFHYEWPRAYSLSRTVPENYLQQCCLLSRQVLELAGKLGFDSHVGRRQIMTDFYNEFQKLILCVLRSENTRAKEKLTQLTAVMSTEEYQQCAAEAHISPNPVYSWLSRQKNGLGLWLWHQIRR